MEGSEDKRLSPRRRSIIGGRLFDDAGRGQDCTIRDLSRTGAALRCEVPPTAGARVDLKINKFEDIRRAEVMWVREGLVGLRFLVPIKTVPKSMERFFTPMQ